MTSVEYRAATAADAEALAALRWELRAEEGDVGDELREAFTTRFAAFAAAVLDEGRWAAWVAEDGAGRLVANVWLHVVPKVPSPGRPTRDLGYVTNVFTVPRLRNQGIGARLLDEVAAWASARELEMLVVWPSERSVPFYRRAEFRPSEDMHERTITGAGPSLQPTQRPPA